MGHGLLRIGRHHSAVPESGEIAGIRCPEAPARGLHGALQKHHGILPGDRLLGMEAPVRIAAGDPGGPCRLDCLGVVAARRNVGEPGSAGRGKLERPVEHQHEIPPAHRVGGAVALAAGTSDYTGLIQQVHIGRSPGIAAHILKVTGARSIAFVGDNENAQTALFQILTGELEPDEGTVKWGQTATFSYFPKDNTKFFKDCDDNLVEWLRQWSSDPHEAYLRGFLGRMLFSGDEVYKPVKVLSGGEKVRCMLSRMMLSGANVLLLDQPTNHLDLESIAALNNGLEAVKCNVLFASHDHQLVQTVANRVFDFTSDGKLIDRKMTYDEYLESQKAD